MTVKKNATRSQEFSDSVIDTIREPLIALDQDLRVVSVSRSFYEFFKVNPEETVGQLIYDLGNKQWDIPKLRELLENILPQKVSFDNYEVEHDFLTIGKRIMLLNARQIKRALGKERIILLAIEDITERRLIEEKLQLAAIVEFSKDAIIGKSLDGTITSWNKGAEEIYGYTKSEIMGKSISVLVPPEMPNELTDILSKIKLGEAIESYETVRQRKDGQYIDVFLTVSAVYDAEGRILGASTISRDITERKRMETLLKESEEQYRLLFENANDGIVLIEKNEGKIANMNPSVEKMLGYSAKESIGNKLQNVGLIIDNSDFQITMKKLNDRGLLRYNDIPIKTKSGKQIYTDTYLVDKAKFAQCNIRDITERKQAEVALRESEERFRIAAKNASDLIWEWDIVNGKLEWFGDIDAILGYAQGEFSRTIDAWERVIHLDDHDRVMAAVDQHLKTQSPYSEEYSVRRKDGTLRYWTDKGVAVCNSQSHPYKMIGVCTDITDRKQAEEQLQRTLESLRKSFGATIQVMVSAIEMRDPYTAGHQLRVANIACAIATEMGLPQDKIEGIRMAGSIHDIGKLSIPAEILSKPTKLTNIEFSLIKEHPQSGYDMLKDVESSWPLAEIVYQHHERMDGSGYPRNLKGDEILLEARIMAVADVVEAMASHRPYRPALGIDAALREIEKNKGTLYDNTVADACLRLFREKGYKLLA
jgi:PAS domain S-box-containing protein